MRDAWGRMRVVGIVESLIGSVKGCAKDESGARTDRSEEGRKGVKKVRWGGVESITYEVASENDVDVEEIV